MRFRDQLRSAAEWAILAGVKVSIIVALLALTLGYLLNDYNIVRQRAFNGQQAFEFLQQQQAAQQKAAPKNTPSTP